MHRFLFFSLLFFFLISCGATNNRSADQASLSGNTDKIIRANAARIISPAVTEQEIEGLVNGSSDFSADLYRKISGDIDQNFVFSPFSISLGFSMVYAGAQGGTEAQLMEVFHYLAQEEHHQLLNALDQQLSSLSKVNQAAENEGAPFQLVIANAVWGQQGMPFKESYLNVLAQQYGAGLQAVDFTQQPGQVTNIINSWIANQTEGRIENLLSSEAISSKTRLVLTNAIYFKGSWATPFNASETELGTFTLNDGRTVQVPMMRRDPLRTTYIENADFQAIQLPYVGDDVYMLIILPHEGKFESVEQQLSSDFFVDTVRFMTVHDIALSMPRFAIETNLPLAAYLKEMGVVDAFNETKANFSGIFDQSNLFVSDAFHQSIILVDEQGTEATAATVAAMTLNALERTEMMIDRPFVFAIIDRETDTVLFLGRVVNPIQ